LTVEEQDSFNNPVTVGGSVTVNLSSNTTGTAVFAASSGGSAVASVTIATGTVTKSFYYGDTKAASPVVTAAISGLTSATQTETITAASASKVAFTTSAVSGAAASSALLGPLTVEEQDSFNNPVTVGGSVTVNLSSNTTGTAVFAASSGGTAVTTVTIATGTVTKSFYYGDTMAGSPVVTAAISGLTSATQTETITAASVSKLAFTTGVQSFTVGTTAGTGSGTITVQQQDSFGNPVTAGSSVSVTLTSTTSGTASFTPTSPVSIGVGSSSVSFIYHDTVAGSWTLTAAATGRTSATQVETVVAAPGNTTVTVGTQSPSPVSAGSSATYSVTVKNTGGNTHDYSLTAFDGLPAGASGNVTAPTCVTLAGGASTTFTLTVSTSTTTPQATSTLQVQATRWTSTNTTCGSGVFEYAQGSGTLVVGP
jgi:hypothetical protein